MDRMDHGHGSQANSAWASSINFTEEESIDNKFVIKLFLVFFASNLLNMSNDKGKPSSLYFK